MKSILPLLLLICASVSLHSQDYLAVEPSENAATEEKTITNTSDYEAIWDINDSISFIPAFDEYCDWNTERVHPYKNNLTKMTDTIYMPLAYDSCSFVAPFIGRKTSDFGYRRYRYHYGVDVKLLTGDPVKCAFEGVVRIAQYDGDYGRVVVVRHNNGLETLYAHLSKLNVKEGDWLEAGDTLGLGGNSGRSTGSHLHFEARYLGEPIDPNALIEWETGVLLHDTLALSQEHFEYLVEVRRRKYHTIRSGDTLSGIARRYGTSINMICRLNGMRRTTTLRIGRKLRYN